MTTWLPRCFALLVLLLPFVAAVAGDPDDKEIARLVKQLGSDVFKEREAATKRLEEIGEPALDALAKATSTLEVDRRAQSIIAAIENKLYLLKAQVASARQVYESRVKRYQGGDPKSDEESLYLWSVRWLNAERDLRKRPADQVAAVAAHLERMKTVEAIARARVDAGGAPLDHRLAAEFYRVQAQIWLAQAKGK